MATFDNNFRSGYIVRINWWVNSQDITNNCTNITVQAQLISTGSSYTIRASAVKNGTLNIDGTNYNFTFNASLSGNQTKTVFEKNIDIYHNGDGTRSCYMGLDLGIEVTLSGKHWGTVSTSGTATFNTIPRKSTISSIDGGWMNSSMTVNIDQKSSAFTTSVYVRAGGCDWQCMAWKQSGTSFTFTLPIDLANYVTTSTECTGQVLVTTYNGDTWIGEDVWDKWMGIPDWVVPNISGVTFDTDTQVNGSWIFVQGKSKMKVTTNASGSYGSSITSIRVDFDGANYWGSEVWTGTMWNCESRPVHVNVWDSRGRYNEYLGSVYVQWYGIPWGNLSAYRCDSNGNRDDTGGKYVRVTYSGDKAYLDGANTFSIKLDHRESGKEWSNVEASHTSSIGDTSIILGSETASYDLEKSYEIRLRISDWYTTTTKIVPISTAFVLLDFKAGGKGLGIGRVATKDNIAQFATGIEIYSGRGNDPNIGADLLFCNVGNESNSIGVCGAVPNSNELLNIHRFTDSATGSSGTIWNIDKWNCIYSYAPDNFFSGDLRFINGEGTIKYNDASGYFFCGDWGMGIYDSNGGAIVTWNYSSQVLFLRSGYQTSDRRKKYDIDEFTNWDDFYNFYMSLKPVTFKYNEDTKNDTHIGFIAQDIADSIAENNLNNEKLAVVKCTENDDYEDGREYAVCYQEMIALNTKMIQEHDKEIQELNNIIAKQQEEIDQLKDMVNQLVNQGGA